MAKDAETVKNESLLTATQSNTSRAMNGSDTKQLSKDSLNFQKKITLNKLESGGGGGGILLIGNKESHDTLIGKIIFQIRIITYTLKSSILTFLDVHVAH